MEDLTDTATGLTSEGRQFGRRLPNALTPNSDSMSTLVHGDGFAWWHRVGRFLSCFSANPLHAIESVLLLAGL